MAAQILGDQAVAFNSYFSSFRPYDGEIDSAAGEFRCRTTVGPPRPMHITRNYRRISRVGGLCERNKARTQQAFFRKCRGEFLQLT